MKLSYRSLRINYRVCLLVMACLMFVTGGLWFAQSMTGAKGLDPDRSVNRDRDRSSRPERVDDDQSELEGLGVGPAEFEDEQGPEKRREWFLTQRAYPFDAIPSDARERAYAMRPAGDKYPISPDHVVQNWTSIGPLPTIAFFSNIEGRVSGRINVIAFSPSDSQRILVGSATGGIWRSTNGGSNFSPVSDSQVSLPVGAIAFAPSDSHIVYAGMGDQDNGYLGAGVLKSTDSGDTWIKVIGTGLPNQATITGIAVDPGNSSRLFAAMSTVSSPLGKFRNVGDGGLYLSTDGGSTWTKPLSGNMSNVVFKPGDSNTLYITWLSPSGGLPAGLWRSTDSGANWKAIDTPNYNASISDMRVAVTPADPKKVYVYGGGCTVTTSACSFAVRFDFSSDGGDNFSYFTAGSGVPQVLSYDIPQPSPSPSLTSLAGPIDTGQFAYNLYLAADPKDAKVVYVGARDVFRSADGGQNFSNITKVWAYSCNNSGKNCSYVFNPTQSVTLTHSDQQSIAINPSDSNKVLIGNDGGLSRIDFSGSAPTATQLNSTLTLSQFVGYAVHPTNDSISYAGSQDNGQQVRGLDSTNVWRGISNGDGGDCVVDFTDPSRAYTSYVQGVINRFKNNGATPDGSGATNFSVEQITNQQTFGECVAPAPAGCTPRMSFYPPLIGSSFEERLYFGTWRLFTSTDRGTTWTVPTTTVDGAAKQDIVDGGTNYLTAIAVARDSSTGKNVIYAGSAAGRLKVSTDGGLTFASAQSGLPNRYITSITVDQSNPTIAYATLSGFGSGHVFKTINTGGFWSDISGVIGSGGLADGPVNTLVVDPNNTKTIYVGTDVGVYRSLTDGNTWQEFNSGMPPVPVMRLVVQPSTRNIHAATYGRGAFELISTIVKDTVDGFVKLNGAPVSGVTVKISGAESATTTTDSSGHYTFANLTGGDYSVTPSKDGYVFSPIERNITVTGNMTLADFAATRQYNATTDFSLTNPSGVWSYGYSDNTGFHRFAVSETNENGIQGLNHWANGTGENEPAVRFNGTNDILNYYVHIHHPNNELSLHPGPNCERSVLRFIAPNAGTFDFVAIFEGIDDTPTTTDVAIAVNGSTIHTGLITAFGRDANGGSSGGFFTVQLNAGDTIDFSAGCGSNNDYHEDSTGLVVLLQQNFTTTNNQVFGRVTTSTGQAVSGVKMSLVDENAFFAFNNVTFTDASGNYSFPNVDSSRSFKLIPAKTGYLFSPLNRDVVNPSGSFGIPEFIATQISTGSNGRIALTRSSPSPSSIVTMDSTGANELNLGPGQTPRYSFDGSRITFVVGSTDSSGLFTGTIWTMKADGSNRMAVTDSSTGQPLVGNYAQLSPDSTKLVSTVFTNSPASIISVYDITFGPNSAVASNALQLTGNNELCFGPTWQPLLNTSTGRYTINGKIVFARYNNNAQDIQTISANGSGRATIASGSFVRNNNPSFSYDGTKIIFDSDRDQAHPPCVWVMNADGDNPQKLTNGFFDSNGEFAPDGTMIVFVSSVEGSGDALFVSNADGSGRTRISTGNHDSSPSWGIAQPNPVPAINTNGTGLSPSTVSAGSAFTLIVNGNNFVTGSVVQFNGLNEPTSFVTSNQLTAQIPLTDNPSAVGTYPKTVSVRVVNPAPAGGPSNSVNLTVTSPPPGPPAIDTDGTQFSPNSTTVSTSIFLTINGANFVSGATVSFNGVTRSATFISATQLSTQLTTSDTHLAGALPVKVINPDHQTSNQVNFTITCPPLSIVTYPGGLPSSSQIISAFNYLLLASGGAEPYTFNISSGALPTGLKLLLTSSGPMISGIATTAGTYNFTITVTDASGCTGSRNYSITIGSPAPAQTNTGSNVTVIPGGIGSASITFNSVIGSGMTSASLMNLGSLSSGDVTTPVSETSARPLATLPMGYQFDQNSYALNLSTTASILGPIKTCLAVPWVTDPAVFTKLRIVHDEQGVFVDRTISQDISNGAICGQTTSLGTFAIATSNILLNFSATNYTASEGSGTTMITVNRSGDTSAPATVQYATSDDTAKEGKDYTAAFGVLSFAPGETARSFPVLIIDNGYVDGPRRINLSLSNSIGATLSEQSTSVLTISDNDSLPATVNPIDQARFLVQLHYYDFLSRFPDQSGWDFWTNNIGNCSPQPGCTEVQRVNTSAAYFLSIEFQQTGYLVERLYKTAYGDATGDSTFNGNHQLPVPIVRFSEFLPDTQQIGSGVVVGASGWEQALENNKQAFALAFVQRSRFSTSLPASMTPAEFVDKLNQNAGNVLSTNERTSAITLFGSSTDTSNMTVRAQLLRQIAEDQDLQTGEFNRAFVLMQFFGYLRRDPNTGPDTDYSGFDFWLTKLNQFDGNYINAEMVKAFITSGEYRQRFGQ